MELTQARARDGVCGEGHTSPSAAEAAVRPPLSG
jgi:hypothetical protein